MRRVTTAALLTRVAANVTLVALISAGGTTVARAC